MHRFLKVISVQNLLVARAKTDMCPRELRGEHNVNEVLSNIKKILTDNN